MRSVKKARANLKQNAPGTDYSPVEHGLLRWFHNAHYQAQGYADGVVLLLCDRMQGALNCVKNWCRDIDLSVNADKTTMVLFTNNRMMWGFYNPRLFGTELRMIR
jgi:hypothetical protein